MFSQLYTINKTNMQDVDKPKRSTVVEESKDQVLHVEHAASHTSADDAEKAASLATHVTIGPIVHEKVEPHGSVHWL